MVLRTSGYHVGRIKSTPVKQLKIRIIMISFRSHILKVYSHSLTLDYYNCCIFQTFLMTVIGNVHRGTRYEIFLELPEIRRGKNTEILENQ